MALISIPTISDGTVIDANDVNNPLNTIVNEINGNLTYDNLASSSVTTAKIADDAVTTDKVADEAITNAKLAVATGEPGAWYDWTPTWTNLTVGAGGEVLARYTKIGKTVFATLRFTYGSGSAISGEVSFSLPVTAYSATGMRKSIGTVYIEDLGVTAYTGDVTMSSTTTARIRVFGSAASYVNGASISGTIPFTWATGDFFGLTIVYEAA